jgi:DNA-binding beta-propeller fold protein YncE
MKPALEKNLSLLFVFSAAFFLLILGGCASSELSMQKMMHLSVSSIFWPPPPQVPRIQYVGSLENAGDTEEPKSWFGRAIETIAGKTEAVPIMLRPYGVFAGGGRMYVTDPGSSALYIFDLKNEKYFQVTRAQEDLISPIGVAADGDGTIYLSDSVLRTIFVFDREGKYVREIGSPEILTRPAGIALSGDRLYVVDTHAHQVLAFMKKDGKLLFRFGRNGVGKSEFNYPTNIFIDRNGLLYITDSMNFRIQIFDKDGNFVSAFGKIGDGAGDFSKPKGIAVDSDGHIYVADAQFANVQIFDRDGRILLAFGKTGRGIGEMLLPAGIFIDKQNRIYVADSYNNRVQIFQYLGKRKGAKVETDR